MEENWYKFQEDICSHFRTLGINAQTNKTIQGIRTEHDIDIFIESKFLGQKIIWIIEAKYWETKISKLHVLALRTIVDDIGADKGFIISKSGFQKGAIEAAKNSNIVLRSYEELIQETTQIIEKEILKTYVTRIELIETRYWSHDKKTRMQYGLRGERWEFNIDYSVSFIIQVSQRAIAKAFENNYPIDLNTSLNEKIGIEKADNFHELINWFNLNLNNADKKILEAEIKMRKNGDFNPKN